jgi:hypothetical protein
MALPRKYLAAAAVLLAINFIVYLTQVGGPDVLKWTSALLPIVCGLLAVGGLAGAVRTFESWDRTRAAWLLLAIGTGLSVLGEVSYLCLDAVLGVDVEALGSTPADIAWMAAYLPYIVGLALLADGYRRSGLPLGHIGRYLALIGLGCVMAGVIAVYVLIPILGDGGTELVDKIVYLYYPLADFVLLVPAVGLILMTSQFGGSAAARPWLMLAVAFLLWGAADIAYAYLGWNDLYGDGNLIDAFWNVAYLLIGAAGLSQRNWLKTV